MSSFNKLAVCSLTGVAAALMVQVAQAATVRVNDEMPMNLQLPGFTYVTSGDGLSSELRVNTDGFLFCANVLLGTDPESVTNVTLAPSHTRWTLPSVTDVRPPTAYSGGELLVNRSRSGQSIESSMVCHARGPQGQVNTPFSPYGNGIFQSGLESTAATQYANMVNWLPGANFSWAAPDWTQVPTDACSFDVTGGDQPAVAENTMCAAATGVRREGLQTYGRRAPTLWTKTTGSSFIYLARVDVRLGPQGDAPNVNFSLPDATRNLEDVPNSVDMQVRDGFDSNYLSSTGSWCFLTSLPADLGTSVCSGALVSGSLNGTLPADQAHVVLSLFPSSPAASFYVAVVRQITSDLPPISTPVAAVAVMADPGTMRHESGDGFTGDNVVFGFPQDGGFPRMH